MDKTLVFLEKIKIARKGKGITQEDMASRLGINKIAYNRIETGKTKLSLERFAQIIDILDIDFIRDFDNEVFSQKNDNEVDNLKNQLKEFEKLLLEKQLLIDLLREKSNSIENNTFISAGDEFLKKWIVLMDEDETIILKKIQTNPAIRKLLESRQLDGTKYHRVWVEHFKK